MKRGKDVAQWYSILGFNPLYQKQKKRKNTCWFVMATKNTHNLGKGNRI